MSTLNLKLSNIVRTIRSKLLKFEGDWSMVHMPIDGYHLYQKVNNSLSHYGPYTEGQLVPLMRGMGILKQPWQNCHTFVETRNLVSGGILVIPEEPVPESHKFLAITKQLAGHFGVNRLYTKTINDLCVSDWHRVPPKPVVYERPYFDSRDTFSEDI